MGLAIAISNIFIYVTTNEQSPLMSKKLLFSKDFHSTSVVIYHVWDKNVQQLCSRSLLFYLNGVYSILWYPNAALLLDGRCVCLFICVHTRVCFCFSCIFNIFRTPHMTGRNEARNLTLNSRKGSLLPLCFVQKYIFSNASGVKMLRADVFHL